MKKRGIILTGLTIILFSILVSLMSTHIGNVYESEKIKFEDKLGTEIVIKGDTLVITDYSLTRNTLILSDNTEINYNLIEKLK